MFIALRACRFILHRSYLHSTDSNFIFVIFCKGNARIFVSIQRAAIKQRVGSVGFYERYKLACERLWKTTLQAAWAIGLADVNARF